MPAPGVLAQVTVGLDYADVQLMVTRKPYSVSGTRQTDTC